MITRHWKVNGVDREVSFEPLDRLLDVMRDRLDLLSIKEGCGEGECGTCSLIIDGAVRLACLTAAAQLEDGAELTTAEGLTDSALGRDLMESFDRSGAVQCGYCSPAMLVGGYALLKQQPQVDAEQVRQALAGHLCRCTGYTKIVDAVLDCHDHRAAAGPQGGKQ